MAIKIVTSRDIFDYAPILDGLVSDFGLAYYPAVLTWCGILKDPPEEQKRYWQIWLVKEDDNVIGMCGLYSQNEEHDELWLAWFGILPQHRNRGLGKDVLQWMENHAKSIGAKAVYSYVDKTGKPLSFYYRAGYHRIGTVREYLANHPEISRDAFEDLEDHIITKNIP